MKTKQMKCSNCGSALEIKSNRKQCKCSYCGSINIIEVKKNTEILDVNTVLKKGRQYEGNGHDAKAMKLYDSFLENNPENPDILLARALISLIDSPNDDFNMQMFEEYFNKGIDAAKDDIMSTLEFLMYQFRHYTIPSICTWQQFAYDNLKSISKKDARKRMSTNMLLLFDIQNKIIDLVENSNFEKPSKSYIEEYKYFQNSIVEFGNTLLRYADIYSLKYGFLNKLHIKDSIFTAKISYKDFLKKHGK